MDQTESCCRKSVDMIMIESAQDMLSTQQTMLDEKAKLFSLLGNEVRLKIMYLFLHVERVCVCDLSDILHMNQSPISQHLRKLKDAGLLESKLEGMTIFYAIPSDKKALVNHTIKGS